MKHWLIFALLMVCSFQVHADEWTVFTNAGFVRDAAFDGTYMWYATAGGIVRLDPNDGSLQKFTVLDGLPQNYIYQVALAEDGTVWFASYNCLIRYDGSGFEVIDTNGLSDGTFNPKELCVTAEGHVWIIESRGVYHYYNGTFTEYSEVVNNISFTSSMTIDTSNRIWVSGDRGLARFDGESWSYWITDDKTSVLRKSEDIICDNNGRLWVTTSMGEFYSIENDVIVPHDMPDSVYCKSIAINGDGVIYMAWNDIWAYDGSEFTLIRKSVNNLTVDTLVCDSQNRIWLSYDYLSDHPVECYDGQSWNQYSLKTDIIANQVTSLLVDRDNSLWIGTTCPRLLTIDYPMSSGMSHFDGMNWTDYSMDNGMTFPRINALGFDRDDNMLIMYDMYFVDIFNGSSFSTLPSPQQYPSEFIDMAVDHNNTIWIAAKFKGLWKFNNDEWTFYDEDDGLTETGILCLSVDQDNILWIGTINGLFRFDGEEFELFTDADRLVGPFVSSIAVDSNNVKWFGSQAEIDYWTGEEIRPGGITRYDGSAWTKITTTDGLPHNTVTTVYADRDDKLWAGTQSGLMEFDGESWISYTVEDGLASNTVTVIVEDNDGVYWIGTPNGLSRFVPDPVTTTVDREPAPSSIALTANPNPFNPATTIAFTIPADGPATLAVYNLAGQKVRTLIDSPMVAGSHTIVWDGTGDAGQAVAAGVYFTRLMAGDMAATGKIALIK